MNSKQHSCTCQTCCSDLLPLVIDQEASAEVMEMFFEHVVNCEHCQRCYEVEKCLKDKIKNACQGKCVPEELVNTIQSQINLMLTNTK
ncbi:hypothetical protein [Eisenibacter elegans]|jgi:anti-sigma factor (TIGR02949 family)|uniref:hypothetical protein n=1 Tax=Eisenibacter elegans TaxID=997 RepID=UPI00047ADF0C|nr:hypothetical protein [Eisenibacter elegans]